MHHQKGNLVVDIGPDAARAKAAATQAARNAAAAKAKAQLDAKNTAFIDRFGTTGDIKAALDQYGNLVLQKAILDVNNRPTGEFQVVYLDVASNGTFRIIDGSEAISKVKSAYGKNQESLRKGLYERGYMTERDYVSRSESGLNGAILKSANEFGVEQVQRYTVNGQTDFSVYGSWLSGKASYTGGANIDTEKVSTPKAEADQDIDEFLFDMLGRNATDEEKIKYFNAVQLAEKNASRKSKVSGTTATTTSTLLTEEDYYRIKASILKPSVIGTPLEKITEGTGKIAQSVTTLKEYASAYGVARTTQEILNDVLEGMTVGGTLTTGQLDQQKAKIRTLAKARYSNLSNLIDEGIKVSDIANQFAYYKGKLLGIADNSVSIFDEDIQLALDNKDASGKSQGSVMSLNDYEKLLRTNPKTKPLWLKSSGAKEEASGYALDILRMFGVMA